MAEQPEGRRCKTCRYYEDDGGGIEGVCGRYPPVPVDGAWLWPEVPIYTVCGEWTPANPETFSEAATTIARLVILGDRTGVYALIDKLKEDRG